MGRKANRLTKRTHRATEGSTYHCFRILPSSVMNIRLINLVLTAAVIFAIRNAPQRLRPAVLDLSRSPFPTGKLEFDIALYTPIKRARLLEINGVPVMWHDLRASDGRSYC